LPFAPTTPSAPQHLGDILINNADVVEAVDVDLTVAWRRRSMCGSAQALHLRTDAVASNQSYRQRRMTIEVVAGSGVGNGDHYGG
jgi:hypothetical protein